MTAIKAVMGLPPAAFGLLGIAIFTFYSPVRRPLQSIPKNSQAQPGQVLVLAKAREAAAARPARV